MDRCGCPVDERLRAAALFFSLYGIAKIGAVYPERTNVYDKNTKTVKNELTFFFSKTYNVSIQEDERRKISDTSYTIFIAFVYF